MKYERLTRRTELGIECVKSNCKNKDNCYCAENCVEALKNRLAKLEDEIEKGKLVEFPSMVYSQTHECYILYTKDGEFINSCLCTKAQAEARLKELRND